MQARNSWTDAGAYCRQLCKWADALATCQNDAVRAALAPGSSPKDVGLFTEGNVEKRIEKLRGQVDFVSAAFAAFDRLLTKYATATRLEAYDTGASDGEEFLRWLEQTHPLSAEQRDYVACQRA